MIRAQNFTYGLSQRPITKKRPFNKPNINNRNNFWKQNYDFLSKNSISNPIVRPLKWAQRQSQQQKYTQQVPNTQQLNRQVFLIKETLRQTAVKNIYFFSKAKSTRIIDKVKEANHTNLKMKVTLIKTNSSIMIINEKINGMM